MAYDDDFDDDEFDDDNYFDEDDYYDDYVEEVYFGFDEEEVSGCCAARNLYGFPEYDEMSPDECDQLMLDLQKVILEQREKRCIIIFTNNQQPQTNEILEELGFSHTHWMKKPKHADHTQIRLWWWEPDRELKDYKGEGGE